MCHFIIATFFFNKSLVTSSFLFHVLRVNSLGWHPLYIGNVLKILATRRKDVETKSEAVKVKEAKNGNSGDAGKAGKGAKSALASKAATGGKARKPVAYAASGVAVVVVLAAVVALATKHGLGPLSTSNADVEEGHPLNAPGVHPVYA